MIENIDDWKKAGRIASEALAYGKSLIKADASLLDVTNKVEEKIRNLGGELAFPAQISLNSIAAHYCAYPDDLIIFKEGDLAKLDVGVHINGAIGDTACSVDLGNNSGLVKASLDAVENAIKILRPGITLREIGKIISESIILNGFEPIRNLSGHGLSLYNVHDEPTIPNFDTNSSTELRDIAFAIEPFATTGAGLIQEKGDANVFHQIDLRSMRTKMASELQNEISLLKGLPFTRNQLRMDKFKREIALRELLRAGTLQEYPPLVQIQGNLVSQAEHTVLILDDKVIVTTKAE